MHTFCRNGTTIHYNGDFSGNVLIVTKRAGKISEPFCVPISALLGFCAHYVREKKIEAIEQADASELLLGRKETP